MHPVSAACSLYLFHCIAFPLRHRHLCSVTCISIQPMKYIWSRREKTSMFFNDKSRTGCTYELKTTTPVCLHWLWEVVLKSGYLWDEINPKNVFRLDSQQRLIGNDRARGGFPETGWSYSLRYMPKGSICEKEYVALYADMWWVTKESTGRQGSGEALSELMFFWHSYKKCQKLHFKVEIRVLHL